MATIKTIHIFSLLIFLIILNSTANGAGNVLYAGETLYAGDSISYINYILRLESSCNLVLYDGSAAIWATNTVGQGRDCTCTMQEDGNLVVYRPDGTVVWFSNSWGGRPARDYVLMVRKDRNVVIYGPSRWSTGTSVSRNIVPIEGGAVGNSTGVGVSPTSGTCPQ